MHIKPKQLHSSSRSSAIAERPARRSNALTTF